MQFSIAGDRVVGGACVVVVEVVVGPHGPIRVMATAEINIIMSNRDQHDSITRLFKKYLHGSVPEGNRSILPTTHCRSVCPSVKESF